MASWDVMNLWPHTQILYGISLQQNYTTWPPYESYSRWPVLSLASPGLLVFSLQETCCGSSRGEATISQSLHIASAAKCNWLKGRCHKVKKRLCLDGGFLKESTAFYLVCSFCQKAERDVQWEYDLTAKRTSEATKINWDWPKNCQTQHTVQACGTKSGSQWLANK